MPDPTLTPEQVRDARSLLIKTHRDMVWELASQLTDKLLALSERCPHSGVNKTSREQIFCDDCGQELFVRVELVQDTVGEEEG